MPVLSLSKRPATKRLAGRFDRLRTGMARSYGCSAKSFSDMSRLHFSV